MALEEQDETTATETDKRTGQGEDRRKSGVDRRAGLERRQKTAAQAGYTGADAAADRIAEIPVWNEDAGQAAGYRTIAKPPKRVK